MYHYQQLFTFEQIDELKRDNALVDGRRGGIILGPSHLHGGVYFLFEYNDGFRLFGEIEGFEYIVSREFNCSEIQKLNDYERDFLPNFNEYEFGADVMTIDARAVNEFYKSKFIILDVRGGFAIINKHSTKRHLTMIDKINRGINPH